MDTILKKGITFNLANKITFARIILIPVFVVFLLSRVPYGSWLAAIVFSLAALSDGLDGYIARAHNQVTLFGQFLDPVADKLLISAALIALVDLERLPGWVAMVIIAREFAVSGLRLVATAKNVIMSSSSLGKMKTFFQIVALIGVILEFNLVATWILLGLALFFTLLSGVDYFIKAKATFF